MRNAPVVMMLPVRSECLEERAVTLRCFQNSSEKKEPESSGGRARFLPSVTLGRLLLRNEWSARRVLCLLPAACLLAAGRLLPAAWLAAS
jgi:hypothetical protein